MRVVRSLSCPFIRIATADFASLEPIDSAIAKPDKASENSFFDPSGNVIASMTILPCEFGLALYDKNLSPFFAG